MVPKNEFLPLNDKDVISIGGNYSLIEASGDKKIFLYEINAPQNYDSAKTTESESEGMSKYFPGFFEVTIKFMKNCIKLNCIKFQI